MYWSSFFVLIFAILASAKKRKRLEKILLPTQQIGAESCLDPMYLTFRYSFRDLHNLLETMGKDNFEFFYCYKSYLDSGNALVKAHFFVDNLRHNRIGDLCAYFASDMVWHGFRHSFRMEKDPKSGKLCVHWTVDFSFTNDKLVPPGNVCVPLNQEKDGSGWMSFEIDTVATPPRDKEFELFNGVGMFAKNAGPWMLPLDIAYEQNNDVDVRLRSLYLHFHRQKLDCNSPSRGKDGIRISCRKKDGCGTRARKPAKTRRPLVSRGQQVLDPTRWPWVVAIEYVTKNNGETKRFICSGSLIGPRHVLTAAHCVLKNGTMSPKSLMVFAGATDRKSAAVVERWGTTFIAHPENGTQPNDIDVAIVELNKPLKFTDRIRPICLPNFLADDDKIEQQMAKKTLYAAGFGYTISSYDRQKPKSEQTSNGTKNTDKMYETKERVVSDSICVEKLSESMERRLSQGEADGEAQKLRHRICAQGVAQSDVEDGDSGGPLMYKEAGRWFQTGIVESGYSLPGGPPSTFMEISRSTCEWIFLATNKEVQCVEGREYERTR